MKGQESNVSETVQRATEATGAAPGGPSEGRSLSGAAKRAALVFAEQREATVLVVNILLGIYFWQASPSFLTKDNIANITWIVAPIAIIAIGEVLLLVCGELDLSVGFVLGFSGFLMHYLIDFYSVPAVLAVLLCLLMGVAVGVCNGFITVPLGVSPFIPPPRPPFIPPGLLLCPSPPYPAAT